MFFVLVKRNFFPSSRLVKSCSLSSFSSAQFLQPYEYLNMGAKSLTESHIPIEARKILYSLASTWSDVVDTKDLTVTNLKGAMTNEVFEIHWPTEVKEVPRKVLVRIYGEGVDVFFNREDEIRTFECMSKHGQGPRLLGRFLTGRVEEFIHARTLSAPDMRDADISAIIASKLREFHGLEMPGPKNTILWNRLRNWLKEAKRLCPTEEAREFMLDTMDEEIAILEKELSQDNQQIGFCHNDLQYGNIMIDEESRALTLIDYEYAGYNPIVYDFANHFCEMTADYHSETPHILDFTKYPGLEERQNFVRVYLSSSADAEPTKAEVQKLVQDAEMYTLASNIGWGLWGIISEHVNDIDFDYMEYARQRFRQYWLTKPSASGFI